MPKNIKNFSFKPEKLIALNKINIKMKKNSILALLGQNGAGKSTFIHILSGFELPSSGSVSFFGFDLILNSDVVRNFIGLCPQVCFFFQIFF